MKRLIAAAIIFVFLITACVSSAMAVKSGCNKILELLDNENQIDEANKVFLKNENIFCFFANRSFVEEIEESFARISALNKEEDSAHFYSELQELKLKVTHLKESELFKLRSFF